MLTDSTCSCAIQSSTKSTLCCASKGEQQKFDWAFKLYKATVGRYESEPYKSVEYWLSGLGLHVPFESYKIQQMGFNCETWFKDLADELQIQVGVTSA